MWQKGPLQLGWGEKEGDGGRDGERKIKIEEKERDKWEKESNKREKREKKEGDVGKEFSIERKK